MNSKKAGTSKLLEKTLESEASLDVDGLNPAAAEGSHPEAVLKEEPSANTNGTANSKGTANDAVDNDNARNGTSRSSPAQKTATKTATRKSSSRKTSTSKSSSRKTSTSKSSSRKPSSSKKVPTVNSSIAHAEMSVEMMDFMPLLNALKAAQSGDFAARVSEEAGLGEWGIAFNDLMAHNQTLTSEIARINQLVGEEGELSARIEARSLPGDWQRTAASVNGLINNLTQPTNEVSRVLTAVASGDLSEKIALRVNGQPLKGEFLRIGTVVNTMVDQLNAFASEVTRVALEVGTEGKLGGQAQVKGIAGTWKDLTNSVNQMASNLTSQVRNIAKVATAISVGDLNQKITVEAEGELGRLKETINQMVDSLSTFSSEVTRVSREVGSEGKLGGQAVVRGVAGT